MAEDSSRHLPATDEQQKQIAKLLKKHPDSKDSHEYEDYVANPTRGNADTFISAVFEIYSGVQRDIYLQYIDERPGSNGLFTNEGVPIVLSQVQKEMNETQSNIWTHIISLRREDAERLGYNNPETWMHLLRSQRNMIAQHMKIASENFRWYAAFHNEGHHPHVHMMAYSVDPGEAYLSRKGIETIKSNLAQEIFRQDMLQIYQKQTDVRDDLREECRVRLVQLADGINRSFFYSPEIMQLLTQLSDRLTRHKGKKKYGYLDAPAKKLVDNIVSLLSQEGRIHEMYENWHHLREEVLRTYTNEMPARIPLAQQKEFNPIRNAVVQAAAKINPAISQDLSEPCTPRVDLMDQYEQPSPGSKLSQREAGVPAVSVQQPLQAELISTTLSLIRHLARMLTHHGEELYRQLDSTDSRAKEETNRKKYAIGYGGPKMRM